MQCTHPQAEHIAVLAVQLWWWLTQSSHMCCRDSHCVHGHLGQPACTLLADHCTEYFWAHTLCRGHLSLCSKPCLLLDIRLCSFALITYNNKQPSFDFSSLALIQSNFTSFQLEFKFFGKQKVFQTMKVLIARARFLFPRSDGPTVDVRGNKSCRIS